MPQPTATDRVPMRWLLLLGLVAALGPLSSDSYLPAFPTMRTDFATSNAMIQATLTAMLVGAAVGPLIMGPLSDIIGRRRPFIGSLLVFAVISWAQAFAPTIQVLIGLRLVQGFAGMSASIMGQAILRDMTPDGDLMRSLSRMRLVTLTAPILAPSFGVLALRFTGWRGIFIVTGTMAVLLSVALLRAPASAFRGRATDADRVVRQSLDAYRYLLRDPRVRLGNVSAACMFTALMLYISNGSLVFRDALGIQPSMFGAIFTINALCMLAGSQLAPSVVARYGSQRVYVGAGAVAAFGLAIMLGSALVGQSAARVFFVGLPIVVFTFGLSLILPTKEVMELHPERAGAGAALLRSNNMVLSGLAAVVLGLAPSSTAVPMVVGMFAFGAIAVGSWVRRGRLVGELGA